MCKKYNPLFHTSNPLSIRPSYSRVVIFLSSFRTLSWCRQWWRLTCSRPKLCRRVAVGFRVSFGRFCVSVVPVCRPSSSWSRGVSSETWREGAGRGSGTGSDWRSCWNCWATGRSARRSSTLRAGRRSSADPVSACRTSDRAGTRPAWRPPRRPAAFAAPALSSVAVVRFAASDRCRFVSPAAVRIRSRTEFADSTIASTQSRSSAPAFLKRRTTARLALSSRVVAIGLEAVSKEFNTYDDEQRHHVAQRHVCDDEVNVTHNRTRPHISADLNQSTNNHFNARCIW